MRAPATISAEMTGDMLTPFEWTGESGRERRGVDRLGDDDHLVAVDGQETAVDGGALGALPRLDPDLTLDEDPEQRRVSGQDAQLAVDGAGDDHVVLALPDLAVRCDEFKLPGAHGVLP